MPYNFRYIFEGDALSDLYTLCFNNTMFRSFAEEWEIVLVYPNGKGRTTCYGLETWRHDVTLSF